MGDQPCPKCGNANHDPATGYCKCEGEEPELYRVSGFTAAWLSDVVTGSKWGATVSKGTIPEAVEELVGLGASLVIAQKL